MVFEFLKEAMLNRGWNLARLAEACDVDISLVSKWVSENERKRVVPGPASCEKIAAALGVDPDYVLELAGHRKARPAQQAADNPVQSELDARLRRLGTTLGKYPRVFWLAVVEASERMAGAGEALQPEGPVSGSKEGGVNAADNAQTRHKRGPGERLTGSQRRPEPAAAW